VELAATDLELFVAVTDMAASPVRATRRAGPGAPSHVLVAGGGALEAVMPMGPRAALEFLEHGSSPPRPRSSRC
jgi:hypothetical protein